MFVQFKSVNIVANHQVQMLAGLLRGMLVELDPDNFGAREFLLCVAQFATAADIEYDPGRR
jgi:hypothetical protein